MVTHEVIQTCQTKVQFCQLQFYPPHHRPSLLTVGALQLGPTPQLLPNVLGRESTNALVWVVALRQTGRKVETEPVGGQVVVSQQFPQQIVVGFVGETEIASIYDEEKKG